MTAVGEGGVLGRGPAVIQLNGQGKSRPAPGLAAPNRRPGRLASSPLGVRLVQFIPPYLRPARRGLRDLSLVGLDLPLFTQPV